MRIYIAGPYSQGDVEQNVRNAIDAYLALIRMGHEPFCPHLSHYAEERANETGTPIAYSRWLKMGIGWMALCDAVLRLPGPSDGSDIEEMIAPLKLINVYHDISEIPCLRSSS